MDFGAPLWSGVGADWQSARLPIYQSAPGAGWSERQFRFERPKALNLGLRSRAIKHGDRIVHQLHFGHRKQESQGGLSALVAVDAIDMQGVVATARG